MLSSVSKIIPGNGRKNSKRVSTTFECSLCKVPFCKTIFNKELLEQSLNSWFTQKKKTWIEKKTNNNNVLSIGKLKRIISACAMLRRYEDMLFNIASSNWKTLLQKVKKRFINVWCIWKHGKLTLHRNFSLTK